jgi:hypothetical protein
MIWREQDDSVIRVRKSQRQDFRHEFADLARWKIDHGRDLSSNQLFGGIMFGYLRRRFLCADARSEIDQEADGRLARAFQRRSLNNGADANVDLAKRVETCFVGGAGVRRVCKMHGSGDRCSAIDDNHLSCHVGACL